MKTLRPYQIGAADAADVAFASGAKSALIVMATGLGKTVISAERARRILLEDSTANILFMAHRTDLLRQARKEFIEMCDDLVSTGIISSDETENPDAQALFITFQSMEGRRAQYAPDHFRLIIVDEAHHGYAETYYATLMYFVPKKLFGMTATEERNDGLDIRDIFGEPVYEYPLARAIADGWLAEIVYSLFTDNINLEQLRRYIKAIEGGDRKVTKKHLDTNIFLEERMDRQVEIIRERQKGGKRTAVFCRNADDLKAFHKQMPEAVPYYSDVNFDERVRILEGLRSGAVQADGNIIQTVLVIDMFNEGIDVPDLELLVFRRATDSMVMWLQQLGRGTRLTARKRHIEVLDFVANCDRVLAVQELGLEVTRWGGGGGMQPGIHISGPGWGITFTEEIRDLMGMLERLDVDLYPTIGEAMAAVKRLNPVPESNPQYDQAYRQDPRLPSNPPSYYAGRGWISWGQFLGTGRVKRDVGAFYPTIEEAMVAVQRLNPVPKSQNEFSRVYRQDPRLTSVPQVTYSGRGWVSWQHFLGKLFYLTIEEAMVAVQRLNPVPKTQLEYKGVRASDPHLTSIPNELYAGKGWVSWQYFLNTTHYNTIEEAMAAVQRLNPVPKSQKQYWRVYLQDSRLTSTPYATYKDRGWDGWADFLGVGHMRGGSRRRKG